MAEDIRKVISVDVTGAIDSLEDMRAKVEESGYAFRSLGDAKKYIDMLRASLIDLDEDSDEYADRVEEIDKVQEKLNKAMKVTGSTLKNAEGSYNALSKKMSELKKRFKETNDEAERKSLAKQIVSINDELKNMDASIGNYQRNVGNYEAAFTGALTNIAGKIEALGNPLALAKKGVIALSNAFKTLIANPVGAAIMLIVGALTALKKGFSQSEEASNSLKKAFSALQPVINAVNNVITGFAKIVGKVAETAVPALVNSLQKAGEWMMKLLNTLGIVSDEKLSAFQKSIQAQKEAVKVTQDLTAREIGLTEKKRKYQVEEAKSEMEIAELRDKAAQKDKYTAKEREKFLDQAIAKERSINDQKLALAQEEYDILKRRSELTDNSSKMNDELAAAEANLYNVRKEHFEKEKGLLREKLKAGKEASAAEKSRLEAELKAIEEAEKEAERIKQEELKKIEEINERIRVSGMTSREKDLDGLKRTYDEEKALLEKYGQDTKALTEKYNRDVASVMAGQGEDGIKALDKQYNHRKVIIENTVNDDQEKNRRLYELEKERLTNQMASYEEMMKIDNLSVEQKDEYTRQMEEASARLIYLDAEYTKQIEEDAKKRQEAEEKEHQEKLKRIDEAINGYAEATEALADMVSGIADYWKDTIEERVKSGEIGEEQAKKEFETTKKVQIAMAVITGLQGVATALSGAFTTKSGPWDIVLAAAQAAAITASTAIQVAKIKSTSLGGGGSVSAPSQTAPSEAATKYAPSYSTNMTGSSETVNLANAVASGQSSQRVYVVESDIAQAGRRVQVVESEATF